MTIFCSETNEKKHAIALVRHGVQMLYGIALPDIVRGPDGKPRFPSRPDIHFSYSHTKTHVLCAISLEPVGADIETRRPVSDSLPRKLMSPEEAESFDFFQLWTLRESLFKLRGHGDLRRDRFSARGGVITAPVSGVHCRLYNCVPGCAAAVCSFGDSFPEEIIFVPPSALA